MGGAWGPWSQAHQNIEFTRLHMFVLVIPQGIENDLPALVAVQLDAEGVDQRKPALEIAPEERTLAALDIYFQQVDPFEAAHLEQRRNVPTLNRVAGLSLVNSIIRVAAVRADRELRAAGPRGAVNSVSTFPIRQQVLAADGVIIGVRFQRKHGRLTELV